MEEGVLGRNSPERRRPLADQPAIWTYLAGKLGISGERHYAFASAEEIRLPPSRLNALQIQALEAIVGAVNVSTHATARLSHALGRDLPDLIRLRTGEVKNPPDAVVSPTREVQIVDLLALAQAEGLSVVPWGGGCSPSGVPEVPAYLAGRPRISLDLRHLNRVLAIDPHSHVIAMEAGATAAQMEEALQTHQLTVGSSFDGYRDAGFGGLVASRTGPFKHSQAIARRLLGVRLITPTGTVETSTLPGSDGPDWAGLVVGSEGSLGVITQLTLQALPRPGRHEQIAVLFPHMKAGLAAMKSIAHSGCEPSRIWLADAAETQALFEFRRPSSTLQRWGQDMVMTYLRTMQGVQLGKASLLILGFTGSDEQVAYHVAACQSLCEQHRGLSLGPGPAEALMREKDKLPHLRDALLDRGLAVDTIDVSVRWEGLDEAYLTVGMAISTAIRSRQAAAPLLFGQASRPTRTGVALTLTVVAALPESEALDCVIQFRKAAYDAYFSMQAAKADVTALAASRNLLAVLKHHLDPCDVLNPGTMPLHAVGAPSPTPP